ncbi:hypothetical protein ACEU2D_19940 [Brevibacillus laterosporus]|uniref:hypothetical protein n=1 Tax=Brevibacillus laterosporus TaxID=1465 RepID=UPI0035A59A3F
METLYSRKEKWKRKKHKKTRKPIVFLILLVILTLGVLISLNRAQVNSDKLLMLMQSIGNLVLAAGISFPAILVGIFQVKYPELNKEGKEKIQLDLCTFALIYGVYIVGNSILYLCQYLSFFNISYGISIMLGALIGFFRLFIYLMNKMLKTSDVHTN